MSRNGLSIMFFGNKQTSVTFAHLPKRGLRLSSGVGSHHCVLLNPE